MSIWPDLFLKTLTLTQDVKRLDTVTENLATKVNDMDKRLVRLETLVEVAKYRGGIEKT